MKTLVYSLFVRELIDYKYFANPKISLKISMIKVMTKETYEKVIVINLFQARFAFNSCLPNCFFKLIATVRIIEFKGLG